ncbi:MAG: hypothetical protein KDA05_00625, partial [Phycisphaerales bacterium]|nr:hypothetical protein [Phycisphaerales bacterium]
MPIDLTTPASALALNTLAASDDELKIAVVGLGAIIVIVLSVLHTVRKTTEVRERERTRREVAAYVAEGSMSPDEAARVLSAGMSEEVAAQLARGVSWGMISANKVKKFNE